MKAKLPYSEQRALARAMQPSRPEKNQTKSLSQRGVCTAGRCPARAMVAQQAQKAPDVYRLQRKLASTRRSLTLSGVPGAVADDDTVAHITLGPSAAHCAQLLQLAERQKSRDAATAAAAQAGAAADGDAMDATGTLVAS